MTAILDRDASAETDPTKDGAVTLNRLKATALFTAISDALVFAAPPSMMLPMLDAVKVEAGEGHFIAVATDRFVLGASRVEYRGEPFEMLINGDDARKLARIAKTAKKDQQWREVIIEVAVTPTGTKTLTFRFNSGEALLVKGLELEFVQWRRLVVADEMRMGSAVGTRYAAPYMARFAKVRPGERQLMDVYPTVLVNGQPGRTAVRIGGDFCGVIMPVRSENQRYEVPAWVQDQK